MTPEERKLVAELFDRLASLENTPRDPAAVDAINEGLDRAPNAVYSLVQTVLVQDEALKRADARIRELEGGGEPAPQNTSFLGGMRDQVWGQHEARAGSVPSVRPAGAPGGISSAWRNTGVPVAPAQQPQAAPAPEPAAHGGMGGSFLGTAAAAAAGVVGGSLLMGGIRSMMGGHGGSAFGSASAAPRDAAPWGGGNTGAGGGDLARQAGLDDMGKAPRSQAYDSGDSPGDVPGQDFDGDSDAAGDEGDFDSGDFDGGGSDGGGDE